MKPKIALTIGDAGGIGPEIAVKVAANGHLTSLMEIVLVGAPEIIQQAIDQFLPNYSLVKIGEKNSRQSCIVYDNFSILHSPQEIPLKKSSAAAGLLSYQSVKLATEAVIAGKYDALVTAPVSKESVNLAGIKFQGHTELVAEICGIENFCMMQSDGNFRVAFVTCHVPLIEVIQGLTSEKVLQTIFLLEQAAKADGVKNPKIAIAGFNPHAGEGGFMGREEIEIIIPAMKKAQEKGVQVFGPFPADTLFIENCRRQYDGIVAMYHDQGHIPFKMVAFDRGVNSTLGLPIIRTSVDHGTAFDIAWQGVADLGSLEAALMTAYRRVIAKK